MCKERNFGYKECILCKTRKQKGYSMYPQHVLVLIFGEILRPHVCARISVLVSLLNFWLCANSCSQISMSCECSFSLHAS